MIYNSEDFTITYFIWRKSEEEGFNRYCCSSMYNTWNYIYIKRNGRNYRVKGEDYAGAVISG